MYGRMILHLLTGLSVVLAPTIVEGQEARSSTARQRPGLKYVTPRIPLPNLPIRETGASVPPFLAGGGEATEFSRLVRAAGIIFSGTVTKIQPTRSANRQSVTTVAITFRIENVLRGNAARRELTIHEWNGLWSAGQRYRVGERVLLFLYPQSKLGLTSAVGGPMGRFAMDANGTVLLTRQHISALGRHPVLGGKSRVRFSEFASAVKQAREGE